jgi:predicted NUDIX family phosphoesterase
LNERVQKFNTNLKDAITEAKKMADIDDKMKEIESSLNEDEKREYEQLGLLNDDEKS